MPPDGSHPDIHEAALAYLARRAHGRAELARKLLRKGFDRDAVDAELDRLRAARLVDDGDLAYNFALRRAAEGRRGAARVRAELAARGIDAEAAGAAVRAAFTPEAEEDALRAAFRRQVRSGQTDPVRLARRLVRDGFPVSRVRALLEREGFGAGEGDLPAGDDDAVE